MSRTKDWDFWGAFSVPITVENRDAYKAAMAEVKAANPTLFAFLRSRKMLNHPTRETVDRIIASLPVELQPFYRAQQHGWA